MLLAKLEEEEDKIDRKLHEMEAMDEDDLEVMRRERMAALKKKADKRNQWKAAGHGQYTELHDQTQFFKELKNSERAVVHFYRPTTRRCEIMDAHLGRLASKHMETRFVKVNAEKSEFLAQRLNIWALPTLVLVKDGKTEHSMVGFDEMGGGDDFPTSALEERLLGHGVLLEEFMG